MASFGQRYADFFKEPGRAAAFTNVGAGLMAASGAGLTGAQRANLMMRGLGQANQASQADIERAQRQQQIDFQQEQAERDRALQESNTLAGKRIANSMLMGGEGGMMGPTPGAADQASMMSPAQRATTEYAAATGKAGPMFSQMGKGPDYSRYKSVGGDLLDLGAEGGPSPVYQGQPDEPASVVAARLAGNDPELMANMQALRRAGATTISTPYEKEMDKPVSSTDRRIMTMPNGKPVPVGMSYNDAQSAGAVQFDPDARKNYKTAKTGLGGMRDALKQYKEVLSRAPSQIIPGSAISRELKSAYSKLNVLLKGEEFAALGVLAGPDMAIIEGINPNPTGMGVRFLGRDTLTPTINALEETFDRASARNYETYGVPGVVGEEENPSPNVGDFGTLDANALGNLDTSGLSDAQMKQFEAALDAALGG